MVQDTLAPWAETARAKGRMSRITIDEMMARRYLAAGVRLLWMVWPKYQQVDIWRAGANEPAATLGVSDTLAGVNVLSGFTYPVARLFK